MLARRQLRASSQRADAGLVALTPNTRVLGSDRRFGLYASSEMRMRTPFARGQRGAHRIVVATWMALFAWSAAIGCGRPESGQDNTAGRVRKSGTVRFGYRVDARPFSYRDA